MAALMVVALPAVPAAAVYFEKVSDENVTNVTIDWNGVGRSPPATSDCIGRLADGVLCNGDPEGKGSAPNATGDPDACSGYRWETGHGNTGGIYSKWRNDGLGPRGASRGYWAVCVKDRGNNTLPGNSTAYASIRYSFDLKDYIPPGHTILDADLEVDYEVDADDFNESGSRAVLYGFIRDLDTGLYYKIRGDQSAGNAVPGLTNGDLSGWHGCDYIDVWDAAANNSTGGACGERSGVAKTNVRFEKSRARSFDTVCAEGAPNLTLGQNFGYEGRCPYYFSLADFFKSKAPVSRNFELLFRLVVHLAPGATRSEKFAMTFDDPIFIKTGTPRTPRYGASFAHGTSSIDIVCRGTPGATLSLFRQDHNRFTPEVLIDSKTANGAGQIITRWETGGASPNGTSGISYMTGWWLRCRDTSNGQDAYTKVYLVTPDPEVYLRGRAYYTFLPCNGVDLSQGGDDCTYSKGNGMASNGDHDEDDCEDLCDLANEPGKLWITVKLGKKGAGGYSSSRNPVSGSWGESALAQTAFLGCTSETSCAPENTAGSFRVGQELQQGDNATHCPNDDLNGDGIADLTPSYNGGVCDAAGDYDREDGRFVGSFGATIGAGPLSGSDNDTNARVVPNCFTEQPPTNDGNGGADSHPNWRGGLNDCEFMQGRWAKFLFGASSFRGDGTTSLDMFWWTVGLWLDDKHVVALGQEAFASACVPSGNTDHDNTVLGVDLGAHYACIPSLGDLPSPAAGAGVLIWVANTVPGCESWTTCSTFTDLTDYVNRTLQVWNRLTSNLMEDFANLSETYVNDGGATSITALGTHFLKIFGEPTNPRYVNVGGDRCSTPGVAITPPSNPAGILSNFLRTSIAGSHASNDPFSLGVSALGGCNHAAMGDLRPSLRDGAALTLPAASYLLQDKRDQWFIRMNNPDVRPVLDGWFQNITTRYSRAIGPSNGSNGLNYFLNGVIRADPKAWSDALDTYLENGRIFKFFGGVLLNEQMARAFNPSRVSTPGCYDTSINNPTPACTGLAAWGDGVVEEANNVSTIQFLSSAIDLVTTGLQQYNLLQKRMNDLNPSTVRANAEAKWGFAYWLLKFFNTFFERMPQDRFNASLEEKTRWIAINNLGNPGWVDYLGVTRGPTGGCGNWVYQRSAHTTPADEPGLVVLGITINGPDGKPGDEDNNDWVLASDPAPARHKGPVGDDATAHTVNGPHPMQYREDVSFAGAQIEAGNPIKQDAGYASLDSGMNYLLCRLQYVNDESYKNLADTLFETVGQAYKSFWAMTRYGQNAVPAIGEEPTVSDFSTQLVQFITQWLDYYRLRPTRLLYDNTLYQQARDELGFAGNNDYYFDNVQQVVIAGQNSGRFACNGQGNPPATGTLATDAQKCRDRYFYERSGYNIFLYRLAAKILDNIDFGPTGAFYNLTKLRVERSADLAGDPRGVQNGLSYALNYGRNVRADVRQKFAQTLTDYIPLYLRSRFDAADQDWRIPPELRLESETIRTKLMTFASRWFGDWGNLLFSLRGVKAEYYPWPGTTTPPSNPYPEPVYVTRTDDRISFNWGQGLPDPVLPANYSVRWSSKLNVIEARPYRLQYCWGGGGINFSIDRVRVSPSSSWTNARGPFLCSDYNTTLSTGLHDILVEYYHNTSADARVELRWNLTTNCPANICEVIPTERYYPPYPYDYTFKTAGTFRWIFAVFNTLYESFTPTQRNIISRSIADQAWRYFGDVDGCTGQSAKLHTQIGRQNGRCVNPPLTTGIDPAVIREQHEATSRALTALFKALGLSLKQLPDALPDLSSTTDEGIVFLTHVAEAAKDVMNALNALPDAKRNMTYDRSWAYTMWTLRSFRYFTSVSGAGVIVGPIKASATPGQISAAGSDLAVSLHDVFGDPQARSGLNYLIGSLKAQDEVKMRSFTDNLIDALHSYIQYNTQRSLRFPAVFVPLVTANTNIYDYTSLNLYQKANGTAGLRYLLDPVNEINGLWGKYYDFRTLSGTLFAASDDGLQCNLTTSQGTSSLINDPGGTHRIFNDSDANGNRWDYQADASPYLRTGDLLIGCFVRNAGGNGGFDAALKVGSRFRIQRSDDDANYHATLAGIVPQIPGCTGSYCYTRDYDCNANEVWRYSVSRPAWWPDTANNRKMGTDITTQDLTSGTAAYGPFGGVSDSPSWACTSPIPAPGGIHIWKRVTVDPFEDGNLMVQKNDPQVNFCFGVNPPACDGSPDPKWLNIDHFAVRWSGKLLVPTTRDWNLTVCGDDGKRLYIDGVLRVDEWHDVLATSCNGWSGRLEAGLHDIQLDYYERTGTAEVYLLWNLTGGATCPTPLSCPVIDRAYLFTRDPAQYNQTAQSFFGIVYGFSGALNALYAIASKAAIQQLFDTMTVSFSEYWGSFGGVFGRSYQTRYEAANQSLDPLRDDYSRGTLSTYRNLVLLAGKVGEQAPFALPNATSAGFLRMWDFNLASFLPSNAEKDDLCKLATRGLSPSAQRFYYFGEDGFPESWTSKAFRLNVANTGTSALSAATNCVGAPFTNITNANALRGYMRNRSVDSVIVMLKDICPDTVCDTPLPNAVVYYDPAYATSWIGPVQASRIAGFFNQTGYGGGADPRNPPGVPCSNQTLLAGGALGASAPCGRNFTTMNARDLAYWMQNMTMRDRARGSVVVFSQDVCPDTVCENMTVNNTIARYLAAGGRVVWPGDIPFYYQGIAGGSTVTWGLAGQRVLLGVDCSDYNGTDADCFPAGGSVVATPEFARWGLTQTWNSVRPISYKVVDTNFTQRLWANSVLSGAPTLTRPEGVLNNWYWRNCPQWAYDCVPSYATEVAGAASPDRALPVDSFSIEWTGTFYQPTNNAITFVSNGDDDRQVVVDGSIVIGWNGGAPCAGNTAQKTGTTASLARGFHTLIYRMCESGGDAGANLTVYGSGWPASQATPWGLKSVMPVTTVNVLAHHPRPGEPTLITNISGFHKNYNPVFKESGFVRVWDCSPGASCGWDITGGPTDARLRDLWNVSTFNLTIEVHGGHLATGGSPGAGFRVPDINMAGNDSTLLTYIRNGGRVVWVGDVPMYYQGHSNASSPPNTGNRTVWDYGGERKVLGVRTSDAYGSGQQSTLTWEGMAKYRLGTDAAVTTDTTLRPAAKEDVTYVYRKDSKDNASWWFKDFNDSIVSYKRRTTEFRTHALEMFTWFLTSLDTVGDWEKKLTTYWSNKYWVQVGAISSYKSWQRQTDLLKQLGSDIVNASITLIGRNGSEGISYIWRAELDVDWTTGRGPWGKALLDYTNRNFGLLAHAAWNQTAGPGGLGVNSTLRSSVLYLTTQPAGSTGTWTGVGQP